MKMPIAWHEECLVNARRNLDEAERRFARENENMKRRRTDVIAYETKITEAKKRGLDGFDSERFLRQRLKRI